MGNALKALLITVLAALAYGCSTDGCTDLRSSIPKAGFYSAASAAKISLDSLQITGIGAPGDSVLLAAGTSQSVVYLPMRSAQTSTAWCLSYKWKDTDFPQLNDTITFQYTAQPYFASAECGAMYRYHVRSFTYTTHMIDSVKMTDSLITNNDAEQIQIFFRTAEEEGGER